ncbi:unnamed protein product [Sphenostylis stenocarpa]|uniref:Uncharacterized protein n=1 Tax=Sphenostylis stenocarpa TaxID=92480 RepID=A0AA86VG40_9FABA|nr:unnamed protein product [Sphenostylis stenocarpa]
MEATNKENSKSVKLPNAVTLKATTTGIKSDGNLLNLNTQTLNLFENGAVPISGDGGKAAVKVAAERTTTTERRIGFGTTHRFDSVGLNRGVWRKTHRLSEDTWKNGCPHPSNATYDYRRSNSADKEMVATLGFKEAIEQTFIVKPVE